MPVESNPQTPSKSSLYPAMIGILAERKLLANFAPTSLDEEINPGLVLT
jgi:hypothetical protein